MTSPTHITFAEFLYLLLLTTTGVALNSVNVITVAVASILPDIDTAASFPGRALPFLSNRLERRFGHRTLTHSVLFLVSLSVVSFPLHLVKPDIYACFLAGYASHPFLDTMTVHGVKLFYPFTNVNCVFPLEVNNPHRYRLQTGSRMDQVLCALFLLACVPVFLIANQGYERFIRSAQKNIESAVRDYNEFSKNHLVQANITAYNMLTRQTLHGVFDIVGAINPTTLIFKGPDGDLHTLGNEFGADYVAENIICQKGGAARSFVTSVDMSNLLLSQITSYIDTATDNFLFGDLDVSDKVSLPENIKLFCPITGNGSTVKFNYARYSDVRSLNLEYVFVTKGILTVKSVIPGEQPQAQSASGFVLPRMQNYSQISITLDPKESIEFLKVTGDTIKESQLIARKNLAQFFEDQIVLNQEKIRSLEDQETAFLNEIDQKITNAQALAGLDSAEHANTLNLSRGAFISPEVLRGSRLKWEKSRSAIAQLVASESTTRSKLALEIRKLVLANRQLRAKANAAAKQSEVRSTVKGILVDVRQVPHNNKTQVTFIIKRIS